MEDCKHENVEEKSYMTEYYGIHEVTTVRQCADCKEIIEEKFKLLGGELNEI